VASRVSDLLAELRRRKVFRVGVVYAVVGWAVAQGAQYLFEMLEFPILAAQFVGILVLIGFPIALVLAWAYEVKPDEPRPTGPRTDESSPVPETLELPGISATEHRKSIAVLPFVDMSRDQDQGYFCDGMAEELINALSKVTGLRVAARTSCFHFKGKAEDIREIGRQLGVRTVVEGGVRRAGDRLRVTAQLVSVDDGFHLWSESYDRELKDVFAVQDEISRSIVEALRTALPGEVEGVPGKEPESVPVEEGRELVVAPTRSLEAYDHYLLARHYSEGRHPKSMESALRHFEKAVELDNGFALPYAGIADSYTLLGLYGYLPPEQARSKANAAAVRALELDDGLSEVHASLGNFHLWYSWDWAAAEQEYVEALKLNAGNVVARCWYALLRSAQGRFDEAFDQMAMARELDPLSVYLQAMAGSLRVYSGDIAGAKQALQDVLQREPGHLFAAYMLGMAYGAESKHDDAVSMAEQAASLSNRSPFHLGVLAGTYARAGRDGDAEAVLDELTARMTSEYVSPLILAWGRVALSETDRGLDLLAKAMAQRDPLLYWIHQDLWWDPIRSETRFSDLASRVGSGVVAPRLPQTGQG
jgi:serine/threonine-protein kinase